MTILKNLTYVWKTQPFQKAKLVPNPLFYTSLSNGNVVKISIKLIREREILLKEILLKFVICKGSFNINLSHKQAKRLKMAEGKRT